MMLNLNVQGLTGNISKLKVLIEVKKPICVILTETHVTSEIQNVEIEIDNYDLIRCDSHSRHTGGVIFYVLKSAKRKVIFNKSINNEIWILACEIVCDKKRHACYGIYKSPECTDKNFLIEMDKLCDSLRFEKSNLLIGDFNIDLLKDTYYAKQLKAKINDWGMKQLIKDPTRITKNSKTLIDVVITNNYFVSAKSVLDNKLSDHNNLEIHLNDKAKIEKERIDFKVLKYEPDRLNEFLRNLNWDCENEQSVEAKTKTFSENLKKGVDEFTKVVSVNKKMQNKWYTVDLKKMRETVDLAYKLAVYLDTNDCWADYRMKRNRYSQALVKSENQFVRNSIQEKHGDQKGMWKTLKKLVKSKEKSKYECIEFDGVKTVSEGEIAEKFNRFYIDSIKEINESISVIDFEEFIENFDCAFKFERINIDQLKAIIVGMNNKKDFEGVNAKFLLDCFESVGNHLLNIVNDSMMSSDVASIWKESLVVPVIKVLNSIKCQDFRPVNMLTTCEKILETVVKTQLTKYLDDNEIVIAEQSGYRGQHSCETALNYLISDWKVELDNRKVIICVFIDLKRAFETIDRQLLLKKLSHYGITGNELKWFKMYLSDRFQRTKFGSEFSALAENKLGIPQGSVLGATLFVLYINNIKSVFKNCKIKLFADDTLTYIIGTDIDEMVRQMNSDLNDFGKWLKCNKLKLNIQKTKYMVITHRNIDDLNIIIDGEKINRVKEFNYLGCVVDEQMNFNANADKTCKKMAKKISFMGRIANKLDLQTKKILYRSIIEPHIVYCSTILYLSNETQLDRIQKLQNRALRIILKKNWRTSATEMLKQLDWMSVRQRIKLQVLLFIYKVTNRMLPKYLENSFQSSEGRIHVTRSVANEQLRLPLFRKSSTQKSLLYNGVKDFNKIPVEVRKKKLSDFKRYCIDYVKTLDT